METLKNIANGMCFNPNRENPAEQKPKQPDPAILGFGRVASHEDLMLNPPKVEIRKPNLIRPEIVQSAFGPDKEII